jgi:hypothetical protein
MNGDTASSLAHEVNYKNLCNAKSPVSEGNNMDIRSDKFYSVIREAKHRNLVSANFLAHGDDHMNFFWGELPYTSFSGTFPLPTIGAPLRGFKLIEMEIFLLRNSPFLSTYFSSFLILF